jgi:hypothetical protein
VGQFNVSGTIPIRLADMPVTANPGALSGDATINEGAVCPISTMEMFAVLSVQAQVQQQGSGPVVVGCSALSVSSVTLSMSEVQSNTNFCGGNIASSGFLSAAQQLFAQTFTPELQKIVTQGITTQACLH